MSGNTIYLVASDQSHAALVLYALRSENGDILWSRALGFYDQDAIWNGAGPLPLDGKVYIAVGHEIHLGQPAVGTTTLYALRANTGVPVWSRQLSSVAYHSIDDPVQDPSVLAADEGRLFVNETDDQVHALRANDGVEIWSAAGGIGTMGVASGVLYQRGPVENLAYIALRESDGAHLWVQRFASVHAMAVEGKYLVAVTMSGSSGSLTAFLTGMYASDGTVLWQDPIRSSDVMPVISNGAIYVADYATLDAVRISDGHALWQAHIPDMTASEFDDVAVSPRGNIVFALTSPIIGEDPFFDPATCFCLPPNKVFALDARDGSVYWQYQPPLTPSTERLFGLAVN